MITAIVPIKKESERLKDKNFLNFCGQSLYQVVLDTLQHCDVIDRIIINTDSPIIMNECAMRYSKAVMLERPDYLLGNDVTMNSILVHDLSKVECEHFLQTHVTNPLLTKKTIERAIDVYFQNLPFYDSLFAVEAVKKRAFDSFGKPINHTNELLLQTQHLPEVNIENSNLFLFSRTSFLEAKNSRVGLKPQMFQMSALEGIDIDFKEDFLLAELIMKHKTLFPTFD